MLVTKNGYLKMKKKISKSTKHIIILGWVLLLSSIVSTNIEYQIIFEGVALGLFIASLMNYTLAKD